jgi:diaminopimelate epimerase
MDIPFIKMEGCGNDYVYIDLISGKGPPESALGNLEELARRMSDRHYGIGSDGLILIRPSESGDARMQMFNADGSESEMCGNGIRCVARFLHDEGVTRRSPVHIETGAGVLTLEIAATGGVVSSVRVDMGTPELERSRIPMSGPPGRVIDEGLEVGGRTVRVTAVSMGNPHCVLFVPDVAQAPVSEFGPLIENHPIFPNRTNVEFVQVVSPGEVRQRTWERGSGETLACGTGASAVCVAGALNGKTERNVLIHLKGGDLRLEWGADDHVFMQGPAREVFRGIWRSGVEIPR